MDGAVLYVKQPLRSESAEQPSLMHAISKFWLDGIPKEGDPSIMTSHCGCGVDTNTFELRAAPRVRKAAMPAKRSLCVTPALERHGRRHEIGGRVLALRLPLTAQSRLNAGFFTG